MTLVLFPYILMKPNWFLGLSVVSLTGTEYLTPDMAIEHQFEKQ